MERTATRRYRRLVVCAAATLLCGALLAAPAVAADDAAAWPEVLTLEEAAKFLRLDTSELEGLALRTEVPGRRVGTRWRFNRDALLAWLNGDWTLIATAVPPSTDDQMSEPDLSSSIPDDAAVLAPEAMAQVTATGTTPAQADASPTDDKVPEEPIGEAPEERTAEDVFLRGQRVLLGSGEMVLDTGLFYSENDNRELTLVNGNIGLATVETETFTGFILARYGLFDETELFASTTYRDQDSDVFVGDQRLTGSSRSELGDVRVGVRRTMLREAVGRPDVILTLNGRIPTDDDHSSYALGGGIALVKSIDPVVLFANTNYLHTFSRDFDDVTRLEPEDRIDATVGYAYALNDTITLSTSLSGLFLSETEFDTVTFRQQNLFSLQFGMTSWLAEGLYIEPSVSFGLNGPGDSFAVGATLAYTFDP